MDAPLTEPAAIPWYPLQVGWKRWVKMGEERWIPAGPPEKGWRLGRIQPRAPARAARAGDVCIRDIRGSVPDLE